MYTCIQCTLIKSRQLKCPSLCTYFLKTSMACSHEDAIKIIDLRTEQQLQQAGGVKGEKKGEGQRILSTQAQLSRNNKFWCSTI